MLKNHKELKEWQKAYELCLEIYKVTKTFPKRERYGLSSQIRRAAVSIPSNIAEGYGRKSAGEYIQALYIAYCSLNVSWKLKSFYRGIWVLSKTEFLNSSKRELKRLKGCSRD